MKIRIYGNAGILESWLLARLAGHGVEPAGEGEVPDVLLGIAECSAGGVPDPLEALEAALSRGGLPVTVVVAGSDGGTAERARRAGVPEECILAGERIRAGEILAALLKAVENDLRPELVLVFAPAPPPGGGAAPPLPRAGEEIPPRGCGKTAPSLAWEVLAPYRERVVAVTGPFAGVGRTTLAASLMAYLRGQGEKVAGVDLEGSLKYHLGNPELLPAEGGYLTAGTRWGELYRVPAPDAEGAAALIGMLAQKKLPRGGGRPARPSALGQVCPRGLGGGGQFEAAGRKRTRAPGCGTGGFPRYGGPAGMGRRGGG